MLRAAGVTGLEPVVFAVSKTAAVANFATPQFLVASVDEEARFELAVFRVRAEGFAAKLLLNGNSISHRERTFVHGMPQ